MKMLFILAIAALTFSGCSQSLQTEESQITNTSQTTAATADTTITETYFLPESENWLEFENKNIKFSYPEGFVVKEQGENAYLTNSDSLAPLGMSQGEIWINFTPSLKETSNSGATEGVATENYVTNSEGNWYKIELLMGGNGELTEEAKAIFEKVESTFVVL